MINSGGLRVAVLHCAKGLLLAELRPLSRNLQIILANFRNPLQIFSLGCNTYLDLFTRIKTHSCTFI